MLCPENATVTGFRGIPGATPNLTATATTGPAYSEAEVERTGPNANPVFNFTIPRGDPGLNGTGVVVNTVDELRAAPNNGTATTLGCTATGDQGGGFWRYDAESTATDNTGLVVKPTAVASNLPGRWIRQYGDVTDLRWFGAACDGETDDSDALTAALDSFTNDTGGELYIPNNTAIAKTVTIANKPGLIIRGNNGYGSAYVLYKPTLKWIGPAGGTMLFISNVNRLTMRYMAISGQDVADYGLYFEGQNTGWGVSTFEFITLGGCNKNTVYRTHKAGFTGNDFGRNQWYRCRFQRTSTAITGIPENDALFVYNDSGVQDLFDRCEWIATVDAWVENAYGIYIYGGTPRIHFRDCYTIAWNGLACRNGFATPKLRIVRHYSEDINFLDLANSNTRVLLDECDHPQSGGVSIRWRGASGGGGPLVIKGGRFNGSLQLNNQNASLIISDNPNFSLGMPTSTDINSNHYITEPHRVIRIGRWGQHFVDSNDVDGDGNTTETINAQPIQTHGAINAAAFIPVLYASVNPDVYPSLANGTTIKHNLTRNVTVYNPSTKDYYGADVGREITLMLVGHATNKYNVTAWGDEYKLTGGSYAHSGAGKTDLISFVWDGTYWWETNRSVTPVDTSTDNKVVNALAFVPKIYESAGQQIYVELFKGTTIKHTLSLSTTSVFTPGTAEPGREISLMITGRAGGNTLSFDPIYKLAGGSFTHSGNGKTDILTFVFDGTYWIEKSRSMNITV